MSKIILITRPNHDLTTNYLYFWSEPVIATAKKHRFTILDLAKNKANRKTFFSYLKSKKPAFIFLNGHGSKKEISGYDNEVLINTNSSLPYSPSIIYARSCDSGQILGKLLIQKGVNAFIGYNRKFVFLYDPIYNAKPQKDPIAKIFLEPTNLIPTTIIKGHSSYSAHKRSQENMHKNFSQLLLSSSSSEEKYCASLLWSNIKCQIHLGNPDTKI